MATNHVHQPNLSLVRSPEQIKRDEDTIAAFLAALDASLAAFKLMSASRKDGLTHLPGSISAIVHDDASSEEYALRLWVSAHAAEGVTLSMRRCEYDDGTVIRSLDAMIGGERIAWVQWPIERPAPVARVDIDSNQMWSPTDGAA